MESAIIANAAGKTKITGPSILNESYPKDAGLKSALMNPKIPEGIESLFMRIYILLPNAELTHGSLKREGEL